MDIIILFEGYSKPSGRPTGTKCKGTCTLIKAPPLNIIVDTMNFWDAPRLVGALQRHHLNCDQIHYVICTHGHADHVGCNYLFQQATQIVGFDISRGGVYLKHNFKGGNPFIICDSVKVVPTPGHMLQHVSVIVNKLDTKSNTSTVYCVAGDLFECEKDLSDDTIWKNAGTDDAGLQQKHRLQMLKIADFIIPGHGPMFRNDKSRWSENNGI